MPRAARPGTLTVPGRAALLRYGRNVAQVTYSVVAFIRSGSSVVGDASACAVSDSLLL
jgi:hypothetical protein